MQVSVETTQGLERRLTITVPAEKIDTEVAKTLRETAKRRRVDGFRPGKVPVSVIKRMFGQEVRQDVVGRVIQGEYVQALIAEKINPAGGPKIEITKDSEGEALEFVATIEVYPEFEVQGVEALEIDKPTVEIKDEDLAEMLETLRKQHATFETVERAAEDGDQVNINFLGKVDGEEFEGGKAENFDLELGAGRMIPGFEDPIIGLKAGDEVVANVTFPEEYHAENLKGKDAEFAITVNSIKGRELPELTEEFVKNFGVESGSVDDLKEEVLKNMTRELEQNLKNQVKENVINGLLGANEVEVPSALLDQEIDALRQQALQRFGGAQQGNMPELPAELFKEQAERRVKIGLILGEFIKSNELKAEDERVLAQIENMASAYEDPTEVVEYYKQNDELMQQMRNVVLEDQAIETILEKAKVTEVAKTFKEVMQPAQ